MDKTKDGLVWPLILAGILAILAMACALYNTIPTRDKCQKVANCVDSLLTTYKFNTSADQEVRAAKADLVNFICTSEGEITANLRVETTLTIQGHCLEATILVRARVEFDENSGKCTLRVITSQFQELAPCPGDINSAGFPSPSGYLLSLSGTCAASVP